MLIGEPRGLEASRPAGMPLLLARVSAHMRDSGAAALLSMKRGSAGRKHYAFEAREQRGLVDDVWVMLQLCRARSARHQQKLSCRQLHQQKLSRRESNPDRRRDRAVY